MDYKELFKITIKLISSPRKAWEEIVVDNGHGKVYVNFVYPMIGLCGLSVFIGSLIHHGWGGPQSFQLAMTNCCAVAVALFAGYFLAAYLINEIGERWCYVPSNPYAIRVLCGYSLVVVFVLRIITGILPDFRIVAWLLQFYTVYVVWEGVPVVMRVVDSVRVRYTLMAAIALLVCPAVIEWIFTRLILMLP